MHDTDILVIGSGIAGLAYALKVHEYRPECSITIVTKGNLQASGSTFAQGGVAAVMDFSNDSYEQHIKDTLTAGDGHCTAHVVDIVIREAGSRIAELSNWGICFDKDKSGNFDLALEGGHSARRILHAADCTGNEIIQQLIRKVRSIPQITLLENHLAVELICKNNVCYGAWILPLSGSHPFMIQSHMTMLATGGVGQVFSHTTNPTVSTGDGIVMAWRAGAKISDMEFIQFHPTALLEEKKDTSFLISEAVRGAGAVLRNIYGERFMSRYDSRLELATRDVVTRAVQTEMLRTGSACVYLDCTTIPKTVFTNHFPGILKKCISIGIDPQQDYIPVVPSAHYCCGGIVTDAYGKTTITDLFAAGECACTGLHGANRLASNSLLEALVFAHRSATLTASIIKKKKFSGKKTAYPFSAFVQDLQVKTNAFKSAMSAAAIIIRDKPLQEAMTLVSGLREEYAMNKSSTFSADTLTYKNMLDTAWLILNAWNSRTQNKGAFFRTSHVSVPDRQ